MVQKQGEHFSHLQELVEPLGLLQTAEVLQERSLRHHYRKNPATDRNMIFHNGLREESRIRLGPRQGGPEDQICRKTGLASHRTDP